MAVSSMKSSATTIMFLLTMVLTFPTRVVGWGTLGHEMVANIAWHRLQHTNDKTAFAALQGALQEFVTKNQTIIDAAGSPLAAVADWADRVRHFQPWSASLHYIDVRDDLIAGGCHYHIDSDDDSSAACYFDYERDCPDDICVAGAIVNYTTQLLAPGGVERLSSSSLRGGDTHQRIDYPTYTAKQQALMFLTQ